MFPKHNFLTSSIFGTVVGFYITPTSDKANIHSLSAVQYSHMGLQLSLDQESVKQVGWKASETTIMQPWKWVL